MEKFIFIIIMIILNLLILKLEKDRNLSSDNALGDSFYYSDDFKYVNRFDLCGKMEVKCSIY